jgi:hypothetical protein
VTTQTSAPIGSTGQSLEGVAVNTGAGTDLFRESVVLTDPNDPDAYGVVVSTQPQAMYGPGVWVQGTPNVSVAALPAISLTGTTQVFGTTSTQIVSSIPFYVAQSSAPWDVRGAVAVTSNVTVQGTSSVNVISSIPFFVAQSSSPWTFNGGVSVTNSPTVNVTNVPQVNITTSIPFFVSQSSAPWSVTGTTSPNVVSSIPYWVSQSSSPWAFVETVSTAGGMSATTIALIATLNTTVVKATPGQVYGILGSNIGSSNVFVRILNASTAATAIASTGVAVVNFGIPISTSPYNNYDTGIPFSAGITIITQQQPYTASTSVAPTASTATITVLFK